MTGRRFFGKWLTTMSQKSQVIMKRWDYGGLVSIFNEDKEGLGGEGSSEFSNLLMLIKPWPGYWKTQLKRINQKVDEGNRKALGKSNVRYRKVRRFSSNEFWKNIGCLVSAPTFGLGGSRLQADLA